jgi:endonuclease-3
LKGSYTLLINLPKTLEIEVGSLGLIEFQSGFYAYNGSAFGPGGLKRVDRHREKVENGGNSHWHLDYVLVQEGAEIVRAFKNSSDHECSLSDEMSERFGNVHGFGCSDCNCKSHLFYSQSRDELEGFLESFYS